MYTRDISEDTKPLHSVTHTTCSATRKHCLYKTNDNDGKSRKQSTELKECVVTINLSKSGRFCIISSICTYRLLNENIYI